MVNRNVVRDETAGMKSMTRLERFKGFLREQDGAVTVDWVVLTAVICFVSVTVVASVQNAALDQSNGIGAAVISKGSNALNSNQYP